MRLLEESPTNDTRCDQRELVFLSVIYREDRSDARASPSQQAARH